MVLGTVGRWCDHRRAINEVVYRVRTGLQRRTLSERFGPWGTVCRRHRRWSADGTEGAAGRIDWDVSVGSTAVRAHQHTAGQERHHPARDHSTA
ncbi:transposase [Streptomyces sp. NPDC007988]|uniref:transposase n=1 Tax=Streptomyces sp. NPDC007988 TaxID=3364802 RepID=UPI0036EA1BDA